MSPAGLSVLRATVAPANQPRRSDGVPRRRSGDDKPKRPRLRRSARRFGIGFLVLVVVLGCI
jgi:hypothetical protein